MFEIICNVIFWIISIPLSIVDVCFGCTIVLLEIVRAGFFRVLWCIYKLIRTEHEIDEIREWTREIYVNASNDIASFTVGE